MHPDHFILSETERWVGKTARIGVQRGENFYSLPRIEPRLFGLSAHGVVIVQCVKRIINSDVDEIALCPFFSWYSVRYNYVGGKNSHIFSIL